MKHPPVKKFQLTGGFLSGYNVDMRSQNWFRTAQLIVLGGFLIFLGACSGGNPEATPTQDVYRPPTQPFVDESTPTPDAAAQAQNQELRPTPEPECTNALWFFDDLSIPDGTVVIPGQRLDKRWLLKNAGTCNWDERYQVRLEAGSNMGVAPQQALYPARSGVELIVRMNFIAPEESGTYRSAWQAYDPDGVPFGDPFFIEVVVP